MPVARALFAGTHLENAPQWLLEIEALTMGGWKLRRGPMVRKEMTGDRGQGHQNESTKRGRRSSVTPQYQVDRFVRISEPRPAPRPKLSARHHHFEQKVILASAKGTVSVAERRAAYGEAFNATNSLVTEEVRATNEASYTEGHKSTEAERVVYVTATNGDSYDERMRFWDLANENAHFVGEHTVTVTTHGVEEPWDRATRDATMPDMLREAAAKAKADAVGSATIAVNDAGVVKRWLSKRTRSFPAELRPHIALKTPHNSRIAYSIVGQFPHDMSPDGMRGCLDKLVGEFTARKIPCQAVIHEPTAKNSKTNWHFHLLYYAGEAEQLDNGRWSFEREYKRDEWGTMKWVPLKRLGRNAEVAADDWVPKIKERWSDIINAQAISEGIATRFTNETNEKRGLPKAQIRYSPGRQALHTQGYFTDTDVEQNIASWQDWRRRKRAQLRTQVQTVRRAYERLRDDPRLSELEEPSHKDIGNRLKRGQMVLDEVDALIDTAVHAAMLRHMMLSGPNDSIAHYTGVDEALSQKPPTASRITRRAFAQEVCAAAHTHLLAIEPTQKRLAELEEASLHKLKEAHTALRAFLPRLGNKIGEAVAGYRDQAAEVGHAHTLLTPTISLRTHQAMAAHFASGRGMD
ncbi:hypothetical protein [Sphingobium sp. BS19]|uniref:hypothetical protein n=1 Tax=Sphingobium sp. BS19 TaxID=3018973 RepID=UPI0022EF27A6|nr:hypothetical protein [Sphingobium sp. BS19]GLI97023.1 hypothetical protein Sbs19_08410 [Sphingobium sp. BS19]